MKSTGSTWVSLWLILIALFSNQAHAELTARLDRDRVALGDALRLTISATAGERINAIDLRPLSADFEILNRSNSSKTSIVNGERSHTQELLLDIRPRREGTLRIPPMRAGSHITNLLLVSVGPAPKGSTAGQTVIFEAEVDKKQVYVQGQVILTLRLQQAINLDGRSINELELDNAFVVPLEQNSFQRTRDGRPWLVHEIRYAIFPEQSGTLEIPSQTFSGREARNRQNFFDLGASGRVIKRETDALRVEVKPSPDSFPGSTWLPARNLTIQESWSTDPEQLKAGESATRTLTLRGEGLQGAQLPPILFPATTGVKYYPDQPLIDNSEVSSGLLGTRQDSAALVPMQSGALRIPEIRIPWWDTQNNKVQYAVVPARDINVTAADVLTTPIATPSPALAPEGNIPLISKAGTSAALYWQIATLVSSLGWLCTLVYLLRTRRQSGPEKDSQQDNPSEQRTFKQLLAACAGGNGAQARKALIEWTACQFPERRVVSLKEVAKAFANSDLDRELKTLNDALYGHSAGNWNGDTLVICAKNLRKLRRQRKDKSGAELKLYPEAA